jgi:hypothetical protein
VTQHDDRRGAAESATDAPLTATEIAALRRPPSESGERDEHKAWEDTDDTRDEHGPPEARDSR